MDNRELDAKMAELMGWKRLSIHSWRSSEDGHRYLPKFSTDISAALPVLEWLRQQYFSIKIIMWDHTYKVAIVGHKRQGHDENIGDLEIEANTLPLAICRAALKAVEEE